MMDGNEKYWLDLVDKLKAQIGANIPHDETTFHNRIWEAISEAFRRGQKCANGFHRGNPFNN